MSRVLQTSGFGSLAEGLVACRCRHCPSTHLLTEYSTWVFCLGNLQAFRVFTNGAKQLEQLTTRR
jgi:hypothetical protein